MQYQIDSISKRIVCVLLVLMFLGCDRNNDDIINFDDISDDEKMIFIVSTYGDNSSLCLPLNGTVNCKISWGDGEEEVVTEPFPMHTYTEENFYTVEIAGTVTRLYSRYLKSTAIIAIENFGKTGLEKLDYAFYGCENLQYIGITDSLFADITNFDYAFCNTGLTEIPVNLFKWCTDATSFKYTFSECINLKEIPSGLFNNCTQAYYFTNTFSGDTSLLEIPTGLFSFCQKAKSFEKTFSGCINLIGESPYTLFDGNKIHLYERDETMGYFRKPLVYDGCFASCEGLSDYADIPDDWLK